MNGYVLRGQKTRGVEEETCLFFAQTLFEAQAVTYWPCYDLLSKASKGKRTSVVKTKYSLN